MKPAGMPGMQTSKSSGMQTSKSSGMQPTGRPGMKPAGMPGMQTSKPTGMQTTGTPGMQPTGTPGMKPAGASITPKPSTSSKPPMAPAVAAKSPAMDPLTAKKSPMDQGSSPPNSNALPETKTPKYTVNSSSGGRKHKKRLTKKRNRRYKR